MDNGEGMPKSSHIGRSGPFGSNGVGWQGSQIDFEVSNTKKPYLASAWDEDICVAAFQTNSKVLLLIRVWFWHFKFNRKGKK